MSAVRRVRSERPSPYARVSQKKASWKDQLSSFFSYLNPLNSKPAEEEAINEDFTYEQPTPTPRTITTNNRSLRGQQGTGDSIKRSRISELSTQPPPPPPVRILPAASTPTISVTIAPPASPKVNEELVRLQTFSAAERQEIVDNLRTDTSENNGRQAFRFSRSLTTTPQRGNSPLASPTRNRFGSPTGAPRTLQENPNGRYRWEGGGSAKTPRARNRFQSPAFNARASPERIVLKDKTAGDIRNDSKRRRLETPPSTTAEVEVPQPPPRSAAPEPPSTRGAQPIPMPETPAPTPPVTAQSSNSNGLSSSRVRKLPPTTPVRPSPLRQQWSQPSPPSGTDSPPSASKQTQAASFMTGLIVKATPVKRPDISNPYQTASPVPVQKPRRRLRPTVKPAAPPAPKAEVEPPKEYSAQAIIEATIPKGSKRSKPPANLTVRSPSPSTPGHFQSTANLPSTEAMDEEEDDVPSSRPSKRLKDGLNDLQPTVNGKSELKQTTPEIIELEEPETTNSVISIPVKPVPVANAPISGLGLKGFAAPKQPSKLRNGWHPETASPSPSPSLGGSEESSASSPPQSSAPFFAQVPQAPKSPPAAPVVAPTPTSSLSLPTSISTLTTTATTTTATTTTAKATPRDRALAVNLAALPTYAFKLPVTGTITKAARMKGMKKAKLASISSLPSFHFEKDGADVTKLASHTTLAPTPTPAPPIAAAAPAVAFNWAASGLTFSAPAGWSCSTCMISNKEEATTCAACETPR